MCRAAEGTQEPSQASCFWLKPLICRTTVKRSMFTHTEIWVNLTSKHFYGIRKRPTANCYNTLQLHAINWNSVRDPRMLSSLLQLEEHRSQLVQQDSRTLTLLCTGRCNMYSVTLFLSGGKLLSSWEAATSNHSTMTVITSAIVLLII